MTRATFALVLAFSLTVSAQQTMAPFLPPNASPLTIYSRAAGEQTGTSRAGSLHLATTPVGNNGDPIDRFVLTSEGRIILNTLIGMREVEVGSADSCGTGYRCLRVAN